MRGDQINEYLADIGNDISRLQDTLYNVECLLTQIRDLLKPAPTVSAPPTGVSAEGAAWAMGACPKCGGAGNVLFSSAHHSASRACTTCGHLWTMEVQER